MAVIYDLGQIRFHAEKMAGRPIDPLNQSLTENLSKERVYFCILAAENILRVKGILEIGEGAPINLNGAPEKV